MRRRSFNCFLSLHAVHVLACINQGNVAFLCHREGVSIQAALSLQNPLEEDVYSLPVFFGDVPRMRHISVLSPLAKQQLLRVIRSCLSPVLFGDTSRCRVGA